VYTLKSSTYTQKNAVYAQNPKPTFCHTRTYELCLCRIVLSCECMYAGVCGWGGRGLLTPARPSPQATANMGSPFFGSKATKPTHAHTRMCANAYTHTHVHTHIQTHTHTCTRKDKCTQIQIDAHERARTHTNAHKRTHTHTNAHIRTHTHTNAHKHTQTHPKAHKQQARAQNELMSVNMRWFTCVCTHPLFVMFLHVLHEIC